MKAGPGSGYVNLHRWTLSLPTAHQELTQRTAALSGWVKAGKLNVPIGHVYPLHDVAQPHRELQIRKTTGKLILSLC
jgi:NADPH:quinone reductase